MARPILATVDAAAMAHNLGVVRARAPRAGVLAVIKANGYGHGLLRAAGALAQAEGYGLLELESAVRLREGGWRGRILLLEGAFDSPELPIIARHDIALVVHCREQIGMLGALPPGAALDVFVKINTGMNRLGFTAGAAAGALAELRARPAVRSVTLMTHFANADDARGVAWQMDAFERAIGPVALPRSLANSAAILRYPETHGDWVRPGVMLYGCSPFAEATGAELGLRPAMTLTSGVIAVQRLERGDTVGYGGLFTAERATRVGVVACGYADGYPRHAPTGTPIVIAGTLTRTLGRVSMDMLCADLTDIPGAGPGSPAVLWGAGLPVERVAAAAGTIGYQLLTALAPRVPVVAA
ncbi:MAG: alanine racemase [Burkholderiales bacterium]|nr:alanine racemase [Burkholderiales bacterium]